jgi:hypothetical protein
MVLKRALELLTANSLTTFELNNNKRIRAMCSTHPVVKVFYASMRVDVSEISVEGVKELAEALKVNVSITHPADLSFRSSHLALGVPFVPGTGEITIFVAALIGGGLGFLWYNAPPAAVFMGDTGSLALGGALGAIAVATKHEIVLAIVAWLIFAVLLWGRYRFGWRGKQALRFTIGGFVTLALAYFGSKFVLEIVLGENWG